MTRTVILADLQASLAVLTASRLAFTTVARTREEAKKNDSEIES